MKEYHCLRINLVINAYYKNLPDLSSTFEETCKRLSILNNTHHHKDLHGTACIIAGINHTEGLMLVVGATVYPMIINHWNAIAQQGMQKT